MTLYWIFNCVRYNEINERNIQKRCEIFRNNRVNYHNEERSIKALNNQ